MLLITIQAFYIRSSLSGKRIICTCYTCRDNHVQRISILKLSVMTVSFYLTHKLQSNIQMKTHSWEDAAKCRSCVKVTIERKIYASLSLHPQGRREGGTDRRRDIKALCVHVLKCRRKWKTSECVLFFRWQQYNKLRILLFSFPGFDARLNRLHVQQRSTSDHNALKDLALVDHWVHLLPLVPQGLGRRSCAIVQQVCVCVCGTFLSVSLSYFNTYRLHPSPLQGHVLAGTYTVHI